MSLQDLSIDGFKELLVFVFCPTGGSPQTQIVGLDILHIVTFLMAYPDATADEMIILLYNQGVQLLTKRDGVPDPSSFYSHKRYYGINVQAIVEKKKRVLF